MTLFKKIYTNADHILWEHSNFSCSSSKNRIVLSRPLKDKPKRYRVVIPYLQGVSEQLRRATKTFKLPTYFKHTNNCGPISHIACDECDASYIGDMEHLLKAHFFEHHRPNSVTSEVSKHIHTDNTSHTVNLKIVDIIDTEPDWFRIGVKETIYIKVNNPSLNRDSG